MGVQRRGTGGVIDELKILKTQDTSTVTTFRKENIQDQDLRYLSFFPPGRLITINDNCPQQNVSAKLRRNLKRYLMLL